MKKTILAIAMSISAVASLFLIYALFILYILLFGITTTDNKLKNYEKRVHEVSGNSELFPDLDALPSYKDVFFSYRKSEQEIFITKTILLAVSYDEKIYASEKNCIENSTDFLEEAVFSRGGGTEYYLPEPKFTINSFNFRVVENSQPDYPKFFGMVAMSDEKNTIAYLYFSDVDLDYISMNTTEGEMKKFVEKHFKYDW